MSAIERSVVTVRTIATIELVPGKGEKPTVVAVKLVAGTEEDFGRIEQAVAY